MSKEYISLWIVVQSEFQARNINEILISSGYTIGALGSSKRLVEADPNTLGAILGYRISGETDLTAESLRDTLKKIFAENGIQYFALITAKTECSYWTGSTISIPQNAIHINEGPYRSNAIFV